VSKAILSKAILSKAILSVSKVMPVERWPWLWIDPP
jgi:hypothetical protein